jgi:hypothetical protein
MALNRARQCFVQHIASLQALRHFIVEVGVGAEYARTGKLVSARLVKKLHQQDLLREEQLISLRLKNIELHNKCALPAACHLLILCLPVGSSSAVTCWCHTWRCTLGVLQDGKAGADIEAEGGASRGATLYRL